MNTRITILFLLIAQILSAQVYSGEAAMYANSFPGGTARSAGVAGAYGSVGADLGGISINPAGLGLYRSTDLSATPGFFIGSNNAGYLGGSTKAPLGQFYFAQAGLAYTHLIKKSGGADEISFNPNKLRSFTIAFNYQRQNIFGRNVDYSGVNNSTSSMGRLASTIDSITPINNNYYPDELVLGWNTYLIDFDTANNRYFSYINAPVRQAGRIETRGGRDDIDLAAGFNVNDKFYIGFGIGIPIVRYNVSTGYGETNLPDSNLYDASYNLSSELRVTGVGVNAKLGIIYRPAQWIRLGLAYQMPTYYKFTDNYTLSANAYYGDTLEITDGLIYTPFKYKLRTPMKGTASVSFFYKQFGFISVDYQFLNYGASRVNLGAGYKGFTDAENNFIKSNYTFGHNIRVGIEGAIKSLRLRGGYAFSSSPYKQSFNTQGGFSEARNYVTAGVGYRGKRFYTDLGYVYGFTKDVSSTMATDYVKNKFTSHQVLLTFGFKLGKMEN